MSKCPLPLLFLCDEISPEKKTTDNVFFFLLVFKNDLIMRLNAPPPPTYQTQQSKMLKCADNDDTITMKADDAGDVVTFVFENPKADKISDFQMKLMDIDTEHLGIPDTEYEATVKMSSNEFQRICRDLSSIGDTVTIAVTKDSVKFTTSGDIGEANITCRRTSDGDGKEEKVKTEDEDGGKGKSSEGQNVDIDLQEPVTLTFALRYLNSFCKATSLCENVRLQLSKELPVVVQYLIEDMGYVRFYLAPKIEEEDADES